MERMQDTHRNDIRVYLQRVVHLDYEHKNNIDAIGTAGEVERQEADVAHLRKKAELQKVKLQLKHDLQSQERAYEEEINSLREKERKEVAKIREKFEKDHMLLVERYEERLAKLKESLELRRKVELHEIEERKNSHINMLIWNHEAKFEETRAYYGALTRDNLNLIQSLIARIEALRASQVENEKAVDVLDQSNQKIKDPLQKTEQELKILAQKLQNYQKDKVSLRQARARKALLQKSTGELADMHRQLQTEYVETVQQRDTLYREFENIVLSVQRQSGARNHRLEAMLTDLQDQYRVKNAQFGAVLKASNLDPVVLQNVTRKLDDVLSAKSEQIDDLRYEVAKASKAYADLVRVYESKLRELNIPSEIDVKDPDVSLANTVPAGLIAT